jgi:hypothetical protein
MLPGYGDAWHGCSRAEAPDLLADRGSISVQASGTATATITPASAKNETFSLGERTIDAFVTVDRN